MRYADLTYEELRDLVPRVQAVFVPLGCTEQQGPHLPADFDTWMINGLCDGIAERLQREHGVLVLVMPALPFGPTPEHAGFGFGYVNLRQSTHEAVVEDVLESLAAQGLNTLIVWRGCGQHDLKAPIDRFNVAHEGSVAYQPLIDYGTIADAGLGGPVPGGHADSFATSIRLHLDREAVRQDRVRVPNWTSLLFQTRASSATRPGPAPKLEPGYGRCASGKAPISPCGSSRVGRMKCARPGTSCPQDNATAALLAPKGRA